MKIERTEHFSKSYKKLVKNNKLMEKQITKTLVLFSQNPNHPSIRLHKLSNQNIWSISVNMRIRIIFVYYKDSAILLDIGDHSIYD